jgi:hypothetical protein
MPATARPKLRGRQQQITLGLPPDLVDAIDALAERDARSRTKMIELLLRDALSRHREPDPLARHLASPNDGPGRARKSKT